MPVLASVFGEGMVLQRGARSPLWGTADPGSTFVLSLCGQQLTAAADAEGKWKAEFLDLEPGGPFELSVGALKLAVWVGDVWLAAGQSNMERTLAAGSVWPTDPLALPGDPAVRQFCLPQALNFSRPVPERPGARWIGSDTDRLLFSAVGYHFAMDLRARTGVPQGILLIAVGGSAAESWLPLEALAGYPRHRDRALWLADPARLAALQGAESARREAWYRDLGAADPPTPRERGPWRSVRLPGTWASWGHEQCGSAWFRKRIELPVAPRGEGRLLLGTLIESDSAWVNGVPVGETGYQYPRRRYAVPEGTLRAGTNEILVRVVVPRGGGAFLPGKPLSLSADGIETDLGGAWDFCPGAVAEFLPEDTFLPLEPAGCYYGMLAPVRGFGVRGVLWYQGESNTARPGDYGPLLRSVVAEFRRLWGADLPFLAVQLPLYGPRTNGAGPDGWAEVQYQQRLLLELPFTGLAVIRDLGDANDIHPGEKSEVGRRLALAARRTVFGEPGGQGPLLASWAADGRRVVLNFGPADVLATSDGQDPRGFFVAGADGVFHEASAVLKGNRVVLESPAVPYPVHVRYAWASNPDANLVGGGLPASLFRTDAGDHQG